MGPGVRKIVEDHKVVIGPVLTFDDAKENSGTNQITDWRKRHVANNIDTSEPISRMLYPMLDTTYGAITVDEPKSNVLGIIAASLFWRTFLGNILPGHCIFRQHRRIHYFEFGTRNCARCFWHHSCSTRNIQGRGKKRFGSDRLPGLIFDDYKPTCLMIILTPAGSNYHSFLWHSSSWCNTISTDEPRFECCSNGPSRSSCWTRYRRIEITIRNA